MLEYRSSEVVHVKQQCSLLGKSGLSAPKEDDHDRGDDKLHRGRERDTSCKNPLMNW